MSGQFYNCDSQQIFQRVMKHASLYSYFTVNITIALSSVSCTILFCFCLQRTRKGPSSSRSPCHPAPEDRRTEVHRRRLQSEDNKNCCIALIEMHLTLLYFVFIHKKDTQTFKQLLRSKFCCTDITSVFSTNYCFLFLSFSLLGKKRKPKTGNQ